MGCFQPFAQNESEIHFERLVFVDRIGGLVEASSRWRMGKWFTVFAENPAGFSGRKNCKVAIICSGRLRCASLPTQKSLSSGRQSHPCGLKLEGLGPLQATPGDFTLVQQSARLRLLQTGAEHDAASMKTCCPPLQGRKAAKGSFLVFLFSVSAFGRQMQYFFSKSNRILRRSSSKKTSASLRMSCGMP